MKDEREQGFFMLETLVAGIAILVMCTCLYSFSHSIEAQAADGCRVRAIFLARTQFAAAQADARAGALRTGAYAWQGREEDLQEDGVVYQVNTSVEGNETDERGTPSGIFEVSVQAAWQGKFSQGKLDMKRTVVAHGEE